MELVTRYDPAAGYEVPMLVPVASDRVWTEEQIEEACMMAEISENQTESLSST